VVAYPVPGKRKSIDLCNAFIEGARRCGGSKEDAAVFYGVKEGNIKAWKRVHLRNQHFYFIDNSYFDESRATHFRVTKNALQYHGMDASSGDRLRDIFGGEPELKPFRDGKHILIIPQSDSHMRCTIGYRGNWLEDTLDMCQVTWPRRPLRIRYWSGNKTDICRTLEADLKDAHYLVTHTSAAAVTALRLGVRVIADAQHALAGWIFQKDRTEIEDQRLHCFRVLADNQWTLDEIKEGKAYAWLNRTSIGSR